MIRGKVVEHLKDGPAISSQDKEIIGLGSRLEKVFLFCNATGCLPVFASDIDAY